MSVFYLGCHLLTKIIIKAHKDLGGLLPQLNSFPEKTFNNTKVYFYWCKWYKPDINLNSASLAFYHYWNFFFSVRFEIRNVTWLDLDKESEKYELKRFVWCWKNSLNCSANKMHGTWMHHAILLRADGQQMAQNVVNWSCSAPDRAPMTLPLLQRTLTHQYWTGKILTAPQENATAPARS